MITRIVSIAIVVAVVAFFLVSVAEGTGKIAPSTTDAVVQISVGESSGSGVLIAPEIVYTAAHVVKGADTVRVKDSTGGLIDVAVVNLIEGADFALLILEKPVTWIRPANYTCDRVTPRTHLHTIGYPLNFDKLTFNLVAAGHYQDPDGPQLLATGVTLPGNSGGPVFNEAGEVVGVIHGEWNYIQSGQDGGNYLVDTDVNIIVPLADIPLICGGERAIG